MAAGACHILPRWPEAPSLHVKCLVRVSRTVNSSFGSGGLAAGQDLARHTQAIAMLSDGSHMTRRQDAMEMCAA